MMTCAEFARLLERAAVRAETEINIPTEIVMASVATEAKAVLGTYEYGWPQLQPATIARIRPLLPGACPRTIDRPPPGGNPTINRGPRHGDGVPRHSWRNAETRLARERL